MAEARITKKGRVMRPFNLLVLPAGATRFPICRWHIGSQSGVAICDRKREG